MKLITEEKTMSLVSLVSVNRCLNVKAAIEKAFNLINFDFRPDIQSIAIKPNMCYYWDYSTGETTDPRLVAELIEFLREKISAKLRIYVVESDASAMQCKHSFKFLGYEKMAKEKNVELVNLSEDRSEKVEVNLSNRSFTFLLPGTLKNADLFINVPKLKIAPQTKITCALKNVYGCNPYPKKFRYHYVLDEFLAGLNKIKKPDLCLVDGLIVRGKYTERLGLLMASTDPVAVDSVVAKIVGLAPKEISHIVRAEKEGIGTTRYRVVGESIQDFVQCFPGENGRDRVWSLISSIGLSTLKKLGRNVDFYS